MPLKVKQVAEAYIGLEDLARKDESQGESEKILTFAGRLKIATRLRKLQDVYEKYDKERTALITKLGEPVYKESDGEAPVQSGYSIKPGTPAFEEFSKKLKEITDVDTEIESLVPLKIADLRENNLPTSYVALLQNIGVLENSPE
jgi:hypothetical protein